MRCARYANGVRLQVRLNGEPIEQVDSWMLNVTQQRTCDAATHTYAAAHATNVGNATNATNVGTWCA